MESASDDDVLHRGEGCASDEEEDDEVDEQEDEEVDEGEDEEDSQVPTREASVFSPSWSEGSNFTPDVHEFQSTSGTTRDWPHHDESAREMDFF